jgi:hypothetical protein
VDGRDTLLVHEVVTGLLARDVDCAETGLPRGALLFRLTTLVYRYKV